MYISTSNRVYKHMQIMHQVQKDFQIIEPRRTSAPDRIGGNGFAGGLFYGLLKGWDLKKCAKFGWSAEH